MLREAYFRLSADCLCDRELADGLAADSRPWQLGDTGDCMRRAMRMTAWDGRRVSAMYHDTAGRKVATRYKARVKRSTRWEQSSCGIFQAHWP